MMARGLHGRLYAPGRMVRVAGIDPGSPGVIVLLECRPEQQPVLVGVASVPDVRELLQRADLVVMEQVASSPQMGAASSFVFGRARGFWEGAMAMLGIEPVRVLPAVWKGSYGLLGGAAGKREDVRLATRLLGAGRAMTHDEADAVLIAWWGWRIQIAPPQIVKRVAARAALEEDVAPDAQDGAG